MKGFTLIELMVVIALVGALSSFAVISLVKPQVTGRIDGAVETLEADIKQQQLKAMLGHEGAGTPEPYGVYFDTATTPDRYVLFKGNSYVSSNAENYAVTLDPGLTFPTVPSANLILFARRSGEITGFVNGQNSVIIRNTSTNEQKTLTINKYGAITVN